MIELKQNSLIFTFPGIHPKARLRIDFLRTLRIPDNGRTYPLPPGLDPFPLRHVDDYAATVSPKWLEQGGVMFPMYQSEALWLRFHSDPLEAGRNIYPFAIKVGTGKINAVTGDQWSDGLRKKPQDYMVSTEQPWLDGYCVKKGLVRQFVAMPLGSGYCAETQCTGEVKHGGIQIVVYPMKREIFERRYSEEGMRQDNRRPFYIVSEPEPDRYDMGMAPGGRMYQGIYEDPFEPDDWEADRRSRCFVHIANSLVWRAITHEPPPTVPFTATEYNRYGLPWYDYYNDEAKVLAESEQLKILKSIEEMGKERGDTPLPENRSVRPQVIFTVRKGMEKEQEREGRL